jgi:Thrombospondin type 3 repeat
LYRSFLRIGIASLTLGLFALGGSHRHAAAAAPAIISVDMDRATPGVQSTLTRQQSDAPIVVDVVIQNAAAIGAFDIEVVFDSSALLLQSWSQGPFLGSTGRQAGCAPIVSQTSLRLGCLTLGPEPPAGASGEGVLATLTFKDAHTSSTCLLLTLAQTATVAGDALPTTGQSGCLTVVADADLDGISDSTDNCPQIANPAQANTDAGNMLLHLPGADALGDACDADIDGDGYSNQSEAALGKSPSIYCAIMRADVDGDGLVSIFDISILVQHYLATVPPAPARYEQGGDGTIGVLDMASIAASFLLGVSACP